ncbi:MAG: hypothetical protein JNK32_03470 [Anaerolineales bacterium]|nr:hypothetical protein [Anaerolineales bacterium]
MSIEYDEKGKFYTNVIHKIPIPSIIQTTTHLIRGLIHVRQGERVKDELENGNSYIAVTDASVCEADGKVVYSGPFVSVQRTQIVWIMPLEQEHHQGVGE